MMWSTLSLMMYWVSGPSRGRLGAIHYKELVEKYFGLEFPAPREVDGELYCLIGNGKMKGKTFPAPREVDTY